MSDTPLELSSLIDPRHTAVIVIDMQNGFCDPSDFPDSVPMLPRLRRFLDEARRAGVQLIFTQVVHDETTDTEVWTSRRRGRPGAHEIVHSGTAGADYHPDFLPQPGDLAIVKHRYSAFIGTPLEVHLRALGIQTVVMTGIATNVCVESTARDAFQREFYVVLAEDCCAAASRALHDGTVENIHRYFGGLVTSSDEILEAWQPVAAAAGRA